MLGPHRSGSSLLTRVVALLVGAEVDRFTHSSNPEGHWEDLVLQPHLDALLRSVGRSWWHPPPADLDWAATEVPARTRAAARRAYAERRRVRRPLVWKDPRLAPTLGFWLPEVEPVLIGALRPPDEVADSLRRRDRLPHGVGRALWQRSYAAVAQAAGGRPILWIDTGRLVADPEIEVARLAAALGERVAVVGDVDVAATSVRSDLLRWSDTALPPALDGLHGTWAPSPPIADVPRVRWPRPHGHLARREIPAQAFDVASGPLRARRMRRSVPRTEVVPRSST